jgi:hypothetical protein
LAALQDTYRKATDTLKLAFPKTVFLHVTVPLQSVPLRPKNRIISGISGLLGRSDAVDDNACREHYNNWVRNSLNAQTAVLDLARVTATGSSGVCVVERRGEAVPMLVADYTHDGGHLNASGRRRAAEAFLVTLASTVTSGRPGDITTDVNQVKP